MIDIESDHRGDELSGDAEVGADRASLVIFRGFQTDDAHGNRCIHVRIDVRGGYDRNFASIAERR